MVHSCTPTVVSEERHQKRRGVLRGVPQRTGACSTCNPMHTLTLFMNTAEFWWKKSRSLLENIVVVPAMHRGERLTSTSRHRSGPFWDRLLAHVGKLPSPLGTQFHQDREPSKAVHRRLGGQRSHISERPVCRAVFFTQVHDATLPVTGVDNNFHQ